MRERRHRALTTTPKPSRSGADLDPEGRAEVEPDTAGLGVPVRDLESPRGSGQQHHLILNRRGQVYHRRGDTEDVGNRSTKSVN